jgi:hypothetical protein
MFKPLAAELKASARLRVGLALIAAVLWVNGLLSLRDRVEEAAKRHAQLAGQINRMRQYAGQTDWPERAKQAKMAQVELEGRLWRGGTPGLAQAAFQDWLAKNLDKSALAHAEEALAQEGGLHAQEPGGDLWKVKVKLSFDFAPPSFNQWIATLASADRQVAIEKLTVRTEPMPRVEAVLVAPFQKAAP